VIRVNGINPGKYRHFKGKEYEVLGCAKHSETLEEYVVYRALYGKGDLWIRPKAMFLEKVLIDNKLVHRFQQC
jgi:cyclomaltodextrinase